ncbi:MAG: chorismate synthase, partial [Candidatus Odinarchaeota archaeon]
ADLTAYIKYGGLNDYRGGGQFSGRITASFVMAGAIAKQILAVKKIDVLAYTYKIANITANIPGLDEIKVKKNTNQLYCPDREASEEMLRKILDAKKEGDSVGGVIQCIVTGLPPGIGEPVFSSIESEISKAIFSIPGVKGIEFGSGFKAALMKGSEHNDPFKYENGRVVAETNNAGGVLGGLSTGMPVIFNVAVKPTASIAKEQLTVDLENKVQTTIRVKGRHDPCIVPRAVPVVEAVTAIVIADLLIQAGFIEQVQPSDKKDIKYQRGLIDRLTFKILELFKQRTDAAMNIAKIKAEKETSIRDIEREKQLLDEAALYAKRIGLPEEDAISLVKELIRLTVKLEEKTSKTGK